MYGKPLFVRAEWDEVARVWVATSDDVPGLATEEDNLEGLIEKLKVMIPELLDVNEAEGEREVPFELLTRRFEIAHESLVEQHLRDHLVGHPIVVNEEP